MARLNLMNEKIAKAGKLGHSLRMQTSTSDT
jgi:hypothetical protein